MSEITVTNADVDALAGKLDGMSDQFSEQERATLQAVWALAASGLHASAVDVEGFAVDAFKPANFELNFTNNQGILIGLNQAFGAGGGAGTSAVGGSMFKFFRKAGGTQDKV